MKDILREAEMYSLIFKWNSVKNAGFVVSSDNVTNFIDSLINQANNGKLWTDKQIKAFNNIIQSRKHYAELSYEINSGDIY